ncbi:MAG: hypothetical protein FJ265_20035 [Planctomycetes bacterium]|nr:hypothetical protein [Planctomycetota bacterium]
MRPTTLLLASLLFPFTLTVSCAAQQPAAETKPFVIDAGELEVTALIDRCATHLRWNIMVNEQELQTAGTMPGGPKFRFQQRTETDDAGCEELLANLLYQRGFALLPLDPEKRIYEVVAMNGPRNREVTNRAVSKTIEQVLARPNLRMPVTTVFKLQHVNAAVATNALRPFLASTSNAGGGAPFLGSVGNNSAMLITGFQDRVAAVVRLLQTVDVPGPAIKPDLAERLERIEARLERLEKALEKAPEKR